LVFLGSATNRFYRHLDPNRRATPELVEAVQRGTHTTLAAVTGWNAQVVLIRDNPEFAFDMPSCLARSARHAWYAMGSREMPIDAVLDPAVANAERVAAAGISNVHYVDFTDHFCSHDMCSGLHGEQVMYRDTDHLTSSYAASLGGVLERALLAAMAQR
jgi:hypothetical protein